MPELREALSSFRPTSNGSDGNLVPVFTASLRETFNSADRSTEAIPPAMFVQVGASVAGHCLLCHGPRPVTLLACTGAKTYVL